MDKLRKVQVSTRALTNFATAFILLLLGGLFGLIQGLNRAGVLEIVGGLNYYELLTAHGIFLILGFTTLFMNGYLYSAVDYVLGGLSITVRLLGCLSFSSFIASALLVEVIVLYV